MMSKEDKELIKAFVANKAMCEAVRRVLLSGKLGDNFDKVNWVWNIDKLLTDAAYGKAVKITRIAIEWINGAFDEMQRLAPTNPQPEQKNQAR